MIVIIITFMAGMLEENVHADKILIQKDKGSNPRAIINAVFPPSLAIYHAHTKGTAACTVSIAVQWNVAEITLLPKPPSFAFSGLNCDTQPT